MKNYKNLEKDRTNVEQLFFCNSIYILSIYALAFVSWHAIKHELLYYTGMEK